MARGIADNQRPGNEVSLWDWGFTMAALVKAGAYQIFHQGLPNGVTHIAKIEDLGSLTYRTLSIHLDRLALYSHSDKITDLLGVKDALDDGYAQVRVLLEEEMACSNLFYHDETGAYYLFPDAEPDEALKQLIRDCFPADLQPYIDMGATINLGTLDGKPPDGREPEDAAPHSDKRSRR